MGRLLPTHRPVQPSWPAFRQTLFLLTATLGALAGCASHSPLPEIGASEPPRFEAVLKPRVGENGEVTAIEVDSVVYGALAADATQFSLTAPVVYAGAWGIADRVKDLVVTDGHGKVALVFEDDPSNPGGFPYFRHWKAQRAVTFPLRVSYHVEVEPRTERRGPPFNIKPSKGGVSGGGSAFLVIPENATANLSRIRWDLSEFAAGASAISSWGEGEFELPGPPAELWPGWYMAGPLGRYPASGDDAGFSAAWLGDFPFDPTSEMQFVGRGYAWLGDFFDYLSPPPRFRVFMRIIDSPQKRFSGTELGSSFMLSGSPNSGEETRGAPPRSTFFHEMIHMWVGEVEGPMGISSWFSEGLTSYYTLVLPLRGGFETVEEYAEEIDKLTKIYYTSPALAMSAQAIADVGFGNEDIRNTPYTRGTMYFADLDARIREKSGGTRSLDDLMREIFRRRQSETGYTFDPDAWVEAITAEMGPQVADEFRVRIMDGEPIVPVSDAFGPCFQRESTSYIVEDLQVPDDRVSGQRVPGYQWVRKPGIPDGQCARK